MMGIYVISCIFDAFVIYLLFESFFENRKAGVQKWHVALGLLLEQVVASFILHHTDSVYVRLVVQIVAVFLLTLFYQGSMLKRILAMTIFVGFSIIAEGVAVVSVALMGVEQEEEEEIVLLLLVEIFLLILVLIAKLFAEKEGNIPVRYQVGYLCVPVLSIVVINGMLSSEPTISWLISLLSILALNMVAYYLVNALSRYCLEQNFKEQVEQQIQVQKEKYEQLSTFFVRGNRLIHDVNKHHRIIKEYLSASNTGEALRYIEKIDGTFEKLYSSVNTGNLVIDSIVGTFKDQLDEINCESKLTINIDKNIKIMEDYDLVVVLGNVTDNIIEAVSGSSKEMKPSVEFKLETTKTAFIFYSKNSVFKAAHKEKDKWYHGLGLYNVRDTIEKYGGSMAVNSSGEYYETMIQVPIREKSYG